MHHDRVRIRFDAGSPPEAAFPADQLDIHLRCHGQPLRSRSRATSYEDDDQTDRIVLRCHACSIRVVLDVRRENPAPTAAPPIQPNREWLSLEARRRLTTWYSYKRIRSWNPFRVGDRWRCTQCGWSGIWTSRGDLPDTTNVAHRCAGSS